MKTPDFRYYADRSLKQRRMAERSASPDISETHMRMAKEYAAMAMLAAIKEG
jgi:hypothetical protein